MHRDRSTYAYIFLAIYDFIKKFWNNQENCWKLFRKFKAKYMCQVKFIKTKNLSLK